VFERVKSQKEISHCFVSKKMPIFTFLTFSYKKRRKSAIFIGFGQKKHFILNRSDGSGCYSEVN
jgi:hypothetical protein